MSAAMMFPPSKTSSRSLPQEWARSWKKLTRASGFTKSYSLAFYIVFAGAACAFCLVRAKYLDINGSFMRAKIVTGDWYYQRDGHQHLGIILHLSAVIPAGMLIPLQFLPIVRYRALWFHRMNGHLLTALLMIGNIGAFMLARRALGGGLDTQVIIGLAGVTTTFAAAMAYYNIKWLQIDEHRAWMLRCWFYAFSIVTQRLVMIPAYKFISKDYDYHVAMPCQVVDFITGSFGPSQMMRYPSCREDPQGWTAVQANFYGAPRIDQIGAAVNSSFGMAGIIGFFLHAVGVEIYLAMTPAEGARLKRLSYRKQLERGFANPGCAGTTSERWGDAEPYNPKPASREAAKPSSKEAVTTAKLDAALVQDAAVAKEVSMHAKEMST